MRLGCLVALALGLRLWGIAFGLPYVFHPDEPLHVSEAVTLMNGGKDALSFANPPLYKYLLVGLFDLVIGQARVADADSSLLFLVARTTSAALGAITVIAVYWLGRLVRGHQAGLIASGLAAVTYLLVRESHFAVNDALAALGATVALVGCVRVAGRGARADYVVAGATLGLAFAAKYQAALVLGPLLLAHVQRGGRRRDVDLLLAIALAVITAVIAFPPLVTETQRVVGDIWVDLVLPSRLGYEGLDRSFGSGYVYYFAVLAWGVGWPMLALAGLGTLGAAARRDWSFLIVGCLPVLLYASLGGSHLFFARFLLPAIPALIVCAAVVLDGLAKRAPLLAAGLAALVLAWTLSDSVRFDTLLSRVDTRTEARAWVQAHLPPGARVLAEREAEGPPLEQLPQDVIHPDGQALFDGSLDEYRRQGIEFVITSSYTADAPNLDPRRDAHRHAFYASLQSDAEELVQFKPYRGAKPDFVYDRLYGPIDSLADFEQPGPTITIYRISQPPRPAGG